MSDSLLKVQRLLKIWYVQRKERSYGDDEHDSFSGETYGSMQKNLNTSYTFILTILLGTPRKQSDAQRCMY